MAVRSRESVYEQKVVELKGAEQFAEGTGRSVTFNKGVINRNYVPFRIIRPPSPAPSASTLGAREVKASFTYSWKM